MYLRSVKIKNIRSIADLEWSVPATKTAGWHVVIGDNGSGKSSFLRSIALALVGPNEAGALRQNWSDWLRSGESNGSIQLTVSYQAKYDKNVRFIVRANAKSTPTNTTIKSPLLLMQLSLRRQTNGQEHAESTVKLSGSGSIGGSTSTGWFSASYGPFRRFSGGDESTEKIYQSNPKPAAHLSVFEEKVALTECLGWLQDLRFKQLEKHPEGDLLKFIKTFVNQAGFLPHQAQLHEVSSTGVTFVDGNGCQVPVESLSDGYRSILSMTFELIRQLVRTYGPDQVFNEDSTKIIVPGVVLIDEVDAHLHPTWQRQVGLWFREHFPKLQFIVTTHSPLVCQAADVGTVFRLPKPGSNERGAMVTGVELGRLVYGNVLDAYSTELFGSGVTRSEASKQQLQRLADLNQKELHGKLSAAERKEQNRLRDTLPTTAHTLSRKTA